MRNKPQQLSSYAKKLLREQDERIADLSNTINELNNWNYQVQVKNDVQSNFIKELKSKNLFQLILWWFKK
jgi:acyl-homoserine lactone acylase PvdQ